MSDIIIVAIISLIGTIITVQLLNHNWFKRQTMKLNNTLELKKLEYAHKRSYAKLTGKSIKTVEGAPAGIPGLMGLLKNLDDETILNIVDSIRGEGYNIPEESADWISTITKLVPKEVIEGFIKGALSKGTESGEKKIIFEQ